MSHEATIWAVKVRGISCTEARVLWHLADCHNPVFGCYPTQEYLAEASEIDVRSVRRCLESLREKRHINWVEQRERNKRRANRYSLAFEPGFRPCDPTQSPETEPDNLSGREESSTGQNCTFEPDSGDSLNRTPESAIEPVIEPVNKPVTERERARAGEGESQQESRDAVERSFKRFYPSWPTYIDDSEPKARAAWYALTPAERAEALERIPDYLAAAKASGRTKVCSASVYLAERRWLKLPAKQVIDQPTSNAAQPFGKGWMGTRFAEFHSQGQPMPAPSPIVRRILDEGGERAEIEIISRNEKYRWPKIAEMAERYRDRKPIRVSNEILAASSDFVSVEIAGPVGQAWKRLHRRMLLPWLPVEPKYAYFPPIDDSATDLDVAVAKAYWRFKERLEGNVQDAAQ